MPIKCTLEDGIVYTEISGELNLEVARSHMEYLASLKDRIRNLYEMEDLNGVTKVSFSADDFHKMVRVATKPQQTYKHEFLAYYAETDFAFGMARMAQIYFELNGHPMHIEVFKDRGEAIRFLKEKKAQYG